ncbi:hypothetical protein AAG570_002817 [Ranatra chinensis]|uniref:Uncharacterized protein n=1 Tax=Ranatra chinensis TaxID=642074 RepID=A0ABD0Y4X8_9HEMI
MGRSSVEGYRAMSLDSCLVVGAPVPLDLKIEGRWKGALERRACFDLFPLGVTRLAVRPLATRAQCSLAIACYISRALYICSSGLPMDSCPLPPAPKRSRVFELPVDPRLRTALPTLRARLCTAVILRQRSESCDGRGGRVTDAVWSIGKTSAFTAVRHFADVGP